MYEILRILCHFSNFNRKIEKDSNSPHQFKSWLAWRAGPLPPTREGLQTEDGRPPHAPLHPPTTTMKNPLTDQRTGPVPSNTRKSSYFGEFSYEAHVTSIASLTRLSYLASVTATKKSSFIKPSHLSSRRRYRY